MQNIYTFFLGTHSDLSAAECWRVLKWKGYDPKIVDSSEQVLVVQLKKELEEYFIDQLGGTDRIAKVKDKNSIIFDAQQIITALSPINAGKKINLGISSINVPADFTEEIGINIKKLLKDSGTRIRFIAGKQQLNSAQIMFNKLTENPNHEITVIHLNDTYYLTDTVQSQDISSYELRDTKKPGRSAKTGMLPPKLAQIMINLAATSQESGKTSALKFYDPFCGSGTILQEGWLMDYEMSGSDKQEAMVRASKKNMDWIKKHFKIDRKLTPTIRLADAKNSLSDDLKDTFDAVASEPFLGNPLSAPLPYKHLMSRIDYLATIYLSAFSNMHKILKKGGAMCFLLPAFREKKYSDNFTLFPNGFLDAISSLGYSKQRLIPQDLIEKFPSSERETIIYARPDALVGREITVWNKV